MSTFNDLQEQIAAQTAEVERQRRTAEAAERARLAAEQAPQRAIAQAEQELQNLQRQAAQAAYDKVAADYHAIIGEIAGLHRQIIAALTGNDFAAALAARDRAVLLAQQAEYQRTHTALGGTWDAADQALYQQMVRDPQWQDKAREKFMAVEVFVSQWIDARQPRAAMGDLPPVPALGSHLSTWVNGASVGSFERDVRAGLAYIVTRQIFDGSVMLSISGPQFGPTR